jgi:hypothetical protein
LSPRDSSLRGASPRGTKSPRGASPRGMNGRDRGGGSPRVANEWEGLVDMKSYAREGVLDRTDLRDLDSLCKQYPQAAALHASAGGTGNANFSFRMDAQRAPGLPPLRLQSDSSDAAPARGTKAFSQRSSLPAALEVVGKMSMQSLDGYVEQCRYDSQSKSVSVLQLRPARSSAGDGAAGEHDLPQLWGGMYKLACEFLGRSERAAVVQTVGPGARRLEVYLVPPVTSQYNNKRWNWSQIKVGPRCCTLTMHTFHHFTYCSIYIYVCVLKHPATILAVPPYITLYTHHLTAPTQLERCGDALDRY